MEKHYIREQIIKIIREFFYKQQFHEVIPELLSPTLPAEPNLRPFITSNLYLPLSPERGMKKLLAQGMGNCFALSKSFRNYERTGALHMREFIMLEWYRKGAEYTNIMTDMELLLSTINTKMGNKIAMKSTSFPRLSLNTLFKEYVGIELSALIQNEELIRQVASKEGYATEGATWEELFDQLFVNKIESQFSLKPFFLVDFPSRISPLCKPQKISPHFAERFELYVHRIELANGNTENTDVAAVREVFEKQSKQTSIPVDEEFLMCLQKMKSSNYAGVGMGVDRLVQLYTGMDIFV